MPREYLEENLPLLESGCDSNMRKQIENALQFGVNVVVAVNKFAADTDAEVNMVVKKALKYGAFRGEIRVN